MARRTTRIGAVLAATVVCGLVAAAASATATPVVFIFPAFSEAHLGEGGTLAIELGVIGSEYEGTPEPLTALTFRYPAGTTLSNEGFPTCAPAILEQFGPIRCPAGSWAGPPGGFTGWVSFGGERVQEEGEVESFFSPEGGVLLFIDGHTPISLELLSIGQYETTPGGPALTFAIPLVESVPGAPYTSVSRLWLELGAFRAEAGEEIASVHLPTQCSEGSFSWSVEGTFMGGTKASAGNTSSCPSAGTKTGATATITTTASPTYPVVGEAVTYTASIAPASASASVPTGSVTFIEDGTPIAGCVNVPAVPGGGVAVAACDSTLVDLGPHAITARYGGDIDFRAAIAEPLMLFVHEPRAASGAGENSQSTGSGSAGNGSTGGGSSGEGIDVTGVQTTTAAIVALLRSLLTPSGDLANFAALARRHGYNFEFNAPSAGTVLVAWYAVAHGARLASKPKPTLIAAGEARPAIAGKARVRVVLTRQGRRILREAKTLTVTAKASFTPTDGTTVTQAGAFVLQR